MVYFAKHLYKNHLLTTLILVFLGLLSIAAVFRIQRQQFPRVDLQELRVTTVYPGASPEDVELNVTVKLEEALKEVSGIENYISSSLENVSTMEIEIDIDVDDPEKVKNDIRRAIESVTDLPPEVDKKPLIEEDTVDNYNIYEVVLTFPGHPEKELRRHAKELKRILLEIPEISRVSENGVRKREIQVRLDRSKMAAKYVSFDEVIHTIKENKLRLAGGSVESFISKKSIVTLSEFENISDIENMIIRSNFLGNRIRIKDIAKVVDSFEVQDTFVRFNGQRGMSLAMAKKGNADIIRTVELIQKAVDSYKTHVPKGLEIFSTMDASIETRNRLSIVSSNAITGFILVLLVLFLFLDPRTAFWTASGIPISVGITLILMSFLNITINSISLCGMVVVLGMVVDDAIIIAEATARARENGMTRADAAFHGLKTVLGPVMGTIATTMIAFIPIYHIPGVIGRFAVDIPSIVILMLAASFVEATTILPAHLAGGKDVAPEDVKAPPGHFIFVYLEKVYGVFLKGVLKHRYISLLGCTLFLVLGGGVSGYFVNFNLFPVDQAYKMRIYGETRDDATLEYNAKESRKLEDIIKKLPKGVVFSYQTAVGANFNDGMNYLKCTNCFVTQMTLTPSSGRDMSLKETKEFIQNEFSKAKEIDIKKIYFSIEGGGPPVGKPIEVKITGTDHKKRKEIIQSVMKDLKALGVKDVDTDFKEGKPEIRLLPDYERIAASNLSVSSIASTIRTAFDGTIVTYEQTPEDNIALRVQLDKDNLSYKHPLQGLQVRNGNGNLVPVDSLVREKVGVASQNIFHHNGYRTNMVFGEIDRDKTNPAEIYGKLSVKYADFKQKYPGFRLQLSGEAEESNRFLIDIAIAVLAAVTAIYFLLVLQFKSFAQPFMVILTVPFGVVGILAAFSAQSMDLSMLALIGVLGFAGVVVNDSLVMVSFINRLRNDKLENLPDGEKALPTEDFNASVIDGSVLRLRPILLTTITTVAGLVPTAYGIPGGLDSFISPMVMSMAWGLLVGTISVLIVIPLLYTIQNDMINLFLRLKK